MMATPAEIKLKVMEPERIIIERTVENVVVEGVNGSFCLKPAHIDFVSALKTGILTYQSRGEEYYVAVDEGILVKVGEHVLVSVINGVEGSDLAILGKAVREQFHKTEALNKAAELAIKSMEADLLLHFMEFGNN